MDSLVTVHSYPSRIEAELAKGMLAANKIPAIIFSDDAGGMKPYPVAYSFGVALKVNSQDLSLAKKLLKVSQ